VGQKAYLSYFSLLERDAVGIERGEEWGSVPSRLGGLQQRIMLFQRGPGGTLATNEFGPFQASQNTSGGGITFSWITILALMNHRPTNRC